MADSNPDEFHIRPKNRTDVGSWQTAQGLNL